MTNTYHGTKIIGGKPKYIEVKYDRSLRIWWICVRGGANNDVLDLEHAGGMRQSFIFDAGSKPTTLREAKDLSMELKIPYRVV